MVPVQVVQLIQNKKVLIAPLDWGLGHATRCIPIIKQLLQQQCIVTIAATGIIRDTLMAEFPLLTYTAIPNYNIKYGYTSLATTIKYLTQLPKIKRTIQEEHLWLQQQQQLHNYEIIISDNRFGLYHPTATTIFITHQLQPLSPLGKLGNMLLQAINYYYINKYNQCWVYDSAAPQALAGKLSNPTKLPKVPISYLGNSTRLQLLPNANLVYKAAIILSGPEPQRTILERIILTQLSSSAPAEQYPKKIILVRGLPSTSQPITNYNPNITIINYANSLQLNTIIASSQYIICRSGYTSVMDYLLLHKQCIFIPTPAQSEQQYLATYCAKKQWAICYKQDNFNLTAALTKASNFPFVTVNYSLV